MWNTTELKKFNKHNHYKYNLSCMVYILSIINTNNYFEFQPLNLFQFFQKANKN
jgi:hypothetical protein